MSAALVDGRGRVFAACSATTRPDAVWLLWTTPSTWSAWDRGLRSASSSGAFVAGSTVTIVDRSGRRSRLDVVEVERMRRCALRVELPGARLLLTRTLEGAGDATVVRHEVRFAGPAAGVWAFVLGRRFRRLLGPTVDELVAMAHRHPGG